MSSYAVIKVGGKQYRVQEGERLLVDRVKTDEGKTFHPTLLMLGGDGKIDFAAKTQVTARVVGHVLGEKVRIGKYKPKSGYKKHTGFRASLTQIQIESIGAAKAKAAPAKAAAERPAPAETPAPTPKAEKPAAAEAPKGLPKDYAGMTVAQIAEAAHGWRRPNLEAALEHEKASANRKGAIAALEAALAEKESN